MLKEDDPKYYENCLKIHGYKFTDSDSDEGESESDEESRSMKPPPVPYNQFKDRIIKLDDNKTLISTANTIQVPEKSFKTKKNLKPNFSDNINVLVTKTTHQKLGKLVVNRKDEGAKSKIISKPSTSASTNTYVFENKFHLKSNELSNRKNVPLHTKIDDVPFKDWQQSIKSSVDNAYSTHAGDFWCDTAKLVNTPNIKPSSVQYDDLKDTSLKLRKETTQNSIAREGKHDIEVRTNGKSQNTKVNISIPPILDYPNNLPIRSLHSCILHIDQRSNELPVNQYTFLNNYNSQSQSNRTNQQSVEREISSPNALINTNEGNNIPSTWDSVNCNLLTGNYHGSNSSYQNIHTTPSESETLINNQSSNDENSSLCSYCMIL